MASASKDNHQKWRRLSGGLGLKYQVELAQLGAYEQRLTTLIEQRDRLVAAFGQGESAGCLFPDAVSRKLRVVSAEINEVRVQRDSQRQAVHRAKSMAARAEEKTAEIMRSLIRDTSEDQVNERVSQTSNRREQ